MFCDGCGERIVTGDKFCSKCGKEIKKMAASALTEDIHDKENSKSKSGDKSAHKFPKELIIRIGGELAVIVLFVATLLPVYIYDAIYIDFIHFLSFLIAFPLIVLVSGSICYLRRAYGAVLVFMLIYAEIYIWAMLESGYCYDALLQSKRQLALGGYLVILAWIISVFLCIWGIILKIQNGELTSKLKSKNNIGKFFISVAALSVVAMLLIWLDNYCCTTQDGRTNGELKKEYKEAFSYFEAGEYEEAIRILNGIPSSYRDYNKVQEQKKKVIEGFENEVINQAHLLCAEENYAEALEILDDGIEKMNTERMLEARAEIIEKRRADYFLKAEKYADEKKYSSAIEVLEKLTEIAGEDAEIEEKIIDYRREQIENQVEQYVDSEDYFMAINYLQQQVSSLENEEELLERLDELWELYKNACMADAEAYAENADYNNAVALLRNLKDALGEDTDVSIKLLEYSRSQVAEEVEVLYEEGKYKEAVEYLTAQIKNSDSGLQADVMLSAKLEELQKLYAEELIAKAEKLAEAEEYASAVNVLSGGKNLLIESNSYSELFDIMKEYRKQQAIVDLAPFKKAKDYKSAVIYFTNLFSGDFSELKNDEELVEKQVWYQNKYKEELFEKAEKSYQSIGYRGALKVLEEGKEVIPNDSKLSAKIKYYEGKVPVRLSSLKAYEGEVAYSSKSIVDVKGNVYDEYFYSPTGIFDYQNKAIYFLNNQYEFFQCKLVMINANGNSAREIIIKNDDTDELLFSARLGKKDTDGINVNIDVSEVKFLYIEINGCRYDGTVMVEAQLIK